MKRVNPKLFNYIYNERGAVYCEDRIGVESNLRNDEEKNLQYLGTYFPRSYVEAYTIYNNIFNNEDIYEHFNKKDTIRILDIGSGTGGNLLGLIQVLMEHFENKSIYVISIEGNNNAVEIQLELLTKFEEFVEGNGNILHGSINNIEFANKKELSSKLDRLSLDGTIDIMQSFKVVNEFYREDYDSNKGMYSELMKLGELWLKKSGILCLVDVTNPIEGQTYASIIFNEEVRNYLANNECELVYIIPKCCALNYKKCKKKRNCFSKMVFEINFGEFRKKSKVNYKLFIKKKLGSRVKRYIKENQCNYETCYCRDYDDQYNCTKKLTDPYIL